MCCICFTLKCPEIQYTPSYNITIFKILLMHWMITGILFVVFCKRFSSKRRNIKIQLGSQVPVQMITHVFGSRGNFYFSTRKILKDIPFYLPLVHSGEYRKWSTSENDHHRIFRKWSTYEFMLKIKKGMWSTCRFCKKKFKGKWSTYYLNITNVNPVVNHFLKQETWRNTLFMMATSWRFWVTPQCVFVKHVSHSF